MTRGTDDSMRLPPPVWAGGIARQRTHQGSRVTARPLLERLEREISGMSPWEWRQHSPIKRRRRAKSISLQLRLLFIEALRHISWMWEHATTYNHLSSTGSGFAFGHRRRSSPSEDKFRNPRRKHGKRRELIQRAPVCGASGRRLTVASSAASSRLGRSTQGQRVRGQLYAGQGG